jgi:hypothetical protein
VSREQYWRTWPADGLQLAQSGAAVLAAWNLHQAIEHEKRPIENRFVIY